MQNKYRKAYENIKMSESEFIRACLGDIKATICKYAGNKLKFGNTILWLRHNSKGEEVVFISTGFDNPTGHGAVELYSEDGYDTAEDIARWADIVADVDMKYSRGDKEYHAYID